MFLKNEYFSFLDILSYVSRILLLLLIYLTLILTEKLQVVIKININLILILMSLVRNYLKKRVFFKFSIVLCSI